MITQLTKEQAIAVSESGVIEDLAPREKAEFQLFQECLCMPFSAFHEAIGETMRPVWLHEFSEPEMLREEWISKFGHPREFTELIPKT